MPDKTARGRFVWHELMVPDVAKAHDFYGKVVGWKTQPFEHDPSYQMFAAGTGPLGGTVAHTDGSAHWLPFIGTTDIDATVQQARSLGAKAESEIATIPNGGRWARLTDPQGASFAVYQSTQKPAREQPPKRGEFSWHELATTDYQAAFDFYSALFGWEKAGEADMGPGLGVYFMFGRNGMPLGGIYNLASGMPGPAWTGYVRVKNLNKAVKKAQAGGATLIAGPMEVPGGDWIAQLIDSQGAMFAVHVLKADLEPAAPAGAAPAPEQGTLDFPPASGVPEKVDVAARPEKLAKTKSAAPQRPAKKAAAKPAGKKAAAKKAPARKAAKKRPVQKAAKKAAKKSIKKKAAPKRAKPAARKSPVKKAGKKARRAK